MDESFFIEQSGVRRRAEKHSCEQCGKEFLRRINGRKKRKFCSVSCFRLSTQRRETLICAHCGEEFERQSSRLRTRHGFSFCSRGCKDKAQSMEGGCPDIRPSHYGLSNGEKDYKHLIASTERPVCCGHNCKEARRYLLVVHHIDGDRKNNPKDGSNWEIVCRSCHALRHLKIVNGVWTFHSSSLTPREMLDKV